MFPTNWATVRVRGVETGQQLSTIKIMGSDVDVGAVMSN